MSVAIMSEVCQHIGLNTLSSAAQEMASKFERRVRDTVSPYELQHVDFRDRSFAASCVYMAARKQRLSVSKLDIIAAAGCRAANFESACNLMREICCGRDRRVDRHDRVTNRHGIGIALHCIGIALHCTAQLLL